jgi:ATPase subunit of ABC transporter with duplicated ATPase domains
MGWRDCGLFSEWLDRGYENRCFANYSDRGPMPGEVMIECDNLTKRFGNFTAVDRISFEVAKGEIVGFLGPNGSGKTTVIRMLCGILKPSDGLAEITRVNPGTVLYSASRLPEAMAQLDEALRLKTNDAGTRASLQLARRVPAKLQARGAADQR